MSILVENRLPLKVLRIVDKGQSCQPDLKNTTLISKNSFISILTNFATTWETVFFYYDLPSN
jgi:hypothetical protein